MKGFLLVLIALVVPKAHSINFINGAYEGFTVAIDDNVPTQDCRKVLTNLEATLSHSSWVLHAALEGRARLGSVTVLIPDSWPDTCTLTAATSSNGEKPDLRLGLAHPVHGDQPWTFQPEGCGRPGKFIYLSHHALLDGKNISRSLVREFAKYRYGVYDEVGYDLDPVYPKCYKSQDEEDIVTGCSDKPIGNDDVCDNPRFGPNDLVRLVSPDAKSSLMFAPEAEQVVRFCDGETHDRYAPTKQNLICNRRSVMEVIAQHPDFINVVIDPSLPANVTPSFTYKRRSLTRYVLLIENTKNMNLRETWSFLRVAVRKWAVHDLPDNTEVGLVMANDKQATRLQNLKPLTNSNNRDLFSSNMPFVPEDSMGSACLLCGIREALNMLEEWNKNFGPASSVVVVVAPGIEYSSDLNQLVDRARILGVRFATVNFPGIVRGKPLDQLAQRTGGRAYTVEEQRYNVDYSYLTTYFRLTNAMQDIARTFYQGNPANLPVEIHRRELTDDGRATVTGSFVLDETMGEPAQFAIFIHQTNPLIHSITLTSPGHHTYSRRSDSLLLEKMVKVQAYINETGTWTYTIERFTGNPQPYFVQVLATPKSPNAAVVQARAWLLSGKDSPASATIYTEVKRGDYPVLSAKVEVTAIRLAENGSAIQKDIFTLLDSGSGEPDLTRGDGVYTAYFHAPVEGRYSFEIAVSDNSNVAYSWQPTINKPESDIVCCGSTLKTPAVQPIQPFQRVLAPITASLSPVITSGTGRIGDLRVDILAADLKARLVWTAPDMAGLPVNRYEVHYARSVQDIVDRLGTNSDQWDYGSRPFALAAGSETTFTMEFTKNPSLLDTPLFVCVKAYSGQDSQGSLSNWVRVLVPSPPPPPPSPSTTFTPSWSYTEDDAIIPRMAQSAEFSLELILPIILGVALIGVCLAVYCYICVIRRKHNKDKKTPSKQSKGQNTHPSSPATTIIVPPPQPESNIGMNLSIQFDQCLTEDEKKRMSIANQQIHNHQQQLQQQQQQQQLQQHLEESLMHDAQMMHQPMSPITLTPQNGISTISNGLVRGRTLSPYQSWTASQLLHEHERRHSPYGNEPNSPPPVPPLPAMSPAPNGIYGQQGPIYGVHPGMLHNTFTRNGSLAGHFNPSLQGSLSSVSSGDRKKRNVTMV